MSAIRFPVATALTVAVLMCDLAVPAGAQEYGKITVKPLVKTDSTIVGEGIHYPGGGQAEVTAIVITVPPGMKTGWHKHGVPLFAYIQKGELTVDYGDKGVRVYKPGDAFMEAMDHWHNGANLGDVPVDIMAVYMGGEGGKLVIPKDE